MSKSNTDNKIIVMLMLYSIAILVFGFLLGYYIQNTNQEQTNTTSYNCSAYFEDYNNCPIEKDFDKCSNEMNYWYNYCILISQSQQEVKQ